MRLSFFAFAIISTQVLSADFTVNTTTDLVDVNPGDGLCETIQQSCSLRASIQEANAIRDAVSNITLPAGIYHLSNSGNGENDSATGDLDVTSNIVITGQGQLLSIIDADNIDRHFDVHANEFVSAIELNSLSLINGTSLSEDGGSIRSYGNVVLKSVTFSDNANELSAKIGKGGHVSILGAGSLIADNSTFDSGTASKGGAIYVESSMLLKNSTLSNNISDSGGAIFVEGDAFIDNSIISNNKASHGAGAFVSGFTSIHATIFQSNSASLGAAIYNEGDLFASNTEFANNDAESGAGVFNDDSALLRFANFDSNLASSNGGGLYNLSNITIDFSTGKSNIANDTGGFAFNSGNIWINNSSLFNNDATVNGGAIQNESGNTIANFVSFLNNGVTSDNEIYMHSGATSLRGTYQTGSATRFTQSSSALVQFNDRGYNVSAGISDVTTNSNELATINLDGNRNVIEPPIGSTVTGYYDGVSASSYCPSISQNGSTRAEEQCNSGAFEDTGNTYNMGKAIFASQNIIVSEKHPSPGLDNPQLIRIPVSREGGSDGELIAAYQVIGLSTSGSYSDFTKSNGTLSWEHGESENKFIEVTVNDDGFVEDEENFVIALSSLIDTSNTLETLQITLLDNEIRKGTFEIEEDSLELIEGEVGTLTITRSDYTFGGATVELVTTNTSGIDVSDIYIENSSIQFEDGQTEATVDFSITDNDQLEESQTFDITLYSEGNKTSIGDNDTVHVTIIDNDEPSTYGTITASYPSITDEGTPFKIEFTRDSLGLNIAGTVTVALSCDRERVVLSQEQITFTESNNLIQVDVTIVDDDEWSPLQNANVTMEIISQTGGTETTTEPQIDGYIQFTIQDNDDKPYVGHFYFSATEVTFSNEGEEVIVNILRDGGSSGEETLSLLPVPDTATEDDIQITPSTVTFLDGETSKEITIRSVVDSEFEEETETLSIEIIPSDYDSSVGDPLIVNLNDAEGDNKVLEKSGGSFGGYSLLLLLAVGFRKRRKNV